MATCSWCSQTKKAHDMSHHVTIFEMAPRDGLQNEPRHIPTDDKIALVDLLTRAGLAKIEVASFVSPKWVPQMADGADVLAGITRGKSSYAALTPNMRGLEAALAAGVDEVAVFTSASEGFCQANINCSIAQSMERFAPVLSVARAQGVPVRGYVSCVAVCPYDGVVAPAAVAQVAAQLRELGCYQVSLGDTIGAATPEQTDAMLTVVTEVVAAGDLAGHFHDTHGRALANIDVALTHGVRTFVTSVAGLGGCPYAPGAAGNVATEAVVAALHERGFETGVHMQALEAAAAFAKTLRPSAHGEHL